MGEESLPVELAVFRALRELPDLWVIPPMMVGNPQLCSVNVSIHSDGHSCILLSLPEFDGPTSIRMFFSLYDVELNSGLKKDFILCGIHGHRADV